MIKYKMDLIVPADMVGTIHDVLKDSGIVVSSVLYEDKRQHRNPAAARRKVSFANGVKYKGVSGKDCVMDSLKAGAKSVDDISAYMVTKGFAPSTAPSTLSRLKNEKKIKRAADGLWAKT